MNFYYSSGHLNVLPQSPLDAPAHPPGALSWRQQRQTLCSHQERRDGQQKELLMSWQLAGAEVRPLGRPLEGVVFPEFVPCLPMLKQEEEEEENCTLPSILKPA